MAEEKKQNKTKLLNKNSILRIYVQAHQSEITITSLMKTHTHKHTQYMQ